MFIIKLKSASTPGQIVVKAMLTFRLALTGMIAMNIGRADSFVPGQGVSLSFAPSLQPELSPHRVWHPSHPSRSLHTGIGLQVPATHPKHRITQYLKRVSLSLDADDIGSFSLAGGGSCGKWRPSWWKRDNVHEEEVRRQ